MSTLSIEEAEQLLYNNVSPWILTLRLKVRETKWSFTKVFGLWSNLRYTFLRKEEWSMPKKRQAVRLTTAERDVLEKLVAHGTTSARAINRARILLLLDEGRREQELTTL